MPNYVQFLLSNLPSTYVHVQFTWCPMPAYRLLTSCVSGILHGCNTDSSL